MRILHVIPFFTPEMGGSAQVAFQISSDLAARGHQVEVVTSDYGIEKSRFDVRSFDVSYLHATISRWGFYVTPDLIPWAKEHVASFDVIHMHTMRTFQNAVIHHFALRYGKPYVISAHGTLPVFVQRETPKRIYDTIVGHRILSDANRLIAVSSFEAEQYAEAGVAPDTIRVVLNGMDLSEYSALPARGQLRGRLGIPDGTPIILYLGRLHQRKGIDHLIKAFAKLRQKQRKALLIIAGPDDGELANLQELVTHLGLRDHVCFTGPLYAHDKLSAYVDANVLVSPAVHEIFGLVPFEALMCGTPVVVADDSGSGQLIGDAKAGYLVSYGDLEALSEALARSLTCRKEVVEMVTAGQAFVRAYLDCEMTIGEVERLYTEVATR
jgi:glycosyltransferase involved in cell wall biosynthesis